MKKWFYTNVIRIQTIYFINIAFLLALECHLWFEALSWISWMFGTQIQCFSKLFFLFDFKHFCIPSSGFPAVFLPVFLSSTLFAYLALSFAYQREYLISSLLLLFLSFCPFNEGLIFIHPCFSWRSFCKLGDESLLICRLKLKNPSLITGRSVVIIKQAGTPTICLM